MQEWEKALQQDESAAVSFLLTARDLLDTDLCLSQQLTGLSRQFAALGSVSEENVRLWDLCAMHVPG